MCATRMRFAHAPYLARGCLICADWGLCSRRYSRRATVPLSGAILTNSEHINGICSFSRGIAKKICAHQQFPAHPEKIPAPGGIIRASFGRDIFFKLLNLLAKYQLIRSTGGAKSQIFLLNTLLAGKALQVSNDAAD
jgi:hypothetical protein